MPDNSAYLYAAYVVAALILLGYAGRLFKRNGNGGRN